MIFQQINRTDPEKIYVIGCAESGALVVDQVVSWEETGVTANHIESPAADSLGLVAGVLPAAIASSAYGLVQAYGYYPTALVTIKTSGSTDAAAGTPLYPIAGQDAWEFAAAADTLDDGVDKSFAVLLEAVTFVTTITQETHKVFLRCL